MLIEAAILLITVVRSIRHCQSGSYLTCENLRFKERYDTAILLLRTNIFFRGISLNMIICN